MMRSFRMTFFAVAVLAIACGTAADENPRLINAANIPQAARILADFVPKGWKIESTITGDLNEDNEPDTVLELIEDLPAAIAEQVSERHRALLVLLQRKGGDWQRVGVTRKLLRCTTCFGALAGPEGGGAEIRISKGVLVVDELWGSRETVHTTLRFRFDPSANRVVLIGEDIERHDRATGAHSKESTNFLTGLRVIEGSQYDEKRRRLTKVQPKRERVSPVKQVIEEVDSEHYE